MSSRAALSSLLDDDPVGPLWRAAQVFRLLSFVYALGFQLAVHNDYERVAWSWFLFAVLTVWTGISTIGYLKGTGRRWSWVIAELVIVCVLVISTRFVASADWAASNQSFPTTLWATNVVVSAAILGGPAGGRRLRTRGAGRQCGRQGWLRPQCGTRRHGGGATGGGGRGRSGLGDGPPESRSGCQGDAGCRRGRGA